MPKKSAGPAASIEGLAMSNLVESSDQKQSYLHLSTLSDYPYVAIIVLLSKCLIHTNLLYVTLFTFYSSSINGDITLTLTLTFTPNITILSFL